MSLKVFVDESGKGDSQFFVMAGYVARAEQWAAFNSEWEAALKEPPSVDAFHMTDARWRGHDVKLPKLIDIIKRNVITGLAVTVPNEAYKKEMSGKVGRRMDEPYFLLYYSIMILASTWQIEKNLNEKMDFIFDEQRGISDFIHSIHTKAVELAPLEIQQRLGVWPIHADDKQILPLQAADILAWVVRKSMEQSGEMLGSTFEPVLSEIPLTRWDIDDNRLSKLMSGINNKNRNEGMITEHQFANAVPYWDNLLQRFNKEQLEKAISGKPIPLLSFPAKQMKRYLLVRSCARCCIPHLHKRAGGECLGEGEAAQQA